MIHFSMLVLIGLFVNSSTVFANPDERARAVRNVFQNQSTSSSVSSGEDGPSSFSCKLGGAMNLTLAAIHGSCEAPNIAKPPGGGSDGCNSEQPRSGDMKSTHKPSCAPGPTPSYNKANHEFSESNGVIKDKNNSTDCSGLVTMALCRAGANIKPGDSKCKAYSTAEMINWGQGADCFERVSDGNFKNGDIFVTRGNGNGHTFQVCNAPAGGTSDPSQLTICEASGSKTGLIKRPLDAKSVSSSLSGMAVKHAKGGRGGKASQVLRHLGDKKAGCVAQDKKQFDNEKCLGSCPNISPEAKL